MAFDFDESSRDRKHDVFEAIGIFVFTILILVGGFYALTAGRALEEEVNLTKWAVFGVLILALGSTLTIIKAAQAFGYGRDIFIIAHDPEKGALGDLPLSLDLDIFSICFCNSSLLFLQKYRPFSFLTSSGATYSPLLRL